MKAPVVGSWALAVRGNLVVQNGVNVSVMNGFSYSHVSLNKRIRKGFRRLECKRRI